MRWRSGWHDCPSVLSDKLLAQDAPLEQANKEDRAKAEVIVKALDGLPLALDQAGAYIEETQCGLSGYLDLYSTRRSELLKRRSRLRTDHPEPVATTWSLSFQKVEQANPAAADLLRLCAFLDPDAIPEEIIIEGVSELSSVLGPVAADSFKLNEAIEELNRFSLIRRNPRTKFLNVHRLVQAVLKDAMNADIREIWAERTIRAVNKAFPKVELENWPQCQRCLSHALACAEIIEQYEFTFTEAAKLLDKAASYLDYHAQFSQAEPLYQRALAIYEKALSPEDLKTATTLNNLAQLYHAQGQYAQAEPLYQRALSIREKSLGLDHPRTGITFNNLACLYTDQDQYAQAEPLFLRALTIYENALPPDHPEIATTLDNLAQLYSKQGQNAQAKSLFQRALAIKENLFTPDHPQIAITLFHLAALFKEEDQYDQAEPLYQRALAIIEQVFGPQHKDIVTILKGYADLLRKMNRTAEAAQLEARAKAIRAKSSS